MMLSMEEASLKSPHRRWIIAIAAGIVLIGLIGLLLWNRLASERFARQMVQSEPADPDARSRRMILGTWTDEYQGKRTMTLNDDGTGTMIVELSGWRAALSALRLTFHLKWFVASGRLKEQTIGGEPAAHVQMILKTMGDHVDQPILELTDDRLLLLDGDGKTKYDWRRVRH